MFNKTMMWAILPEAIPAKVSFDSQDIPENGAQYSLYGNVAVVRVCGPLCQRPYFLGTTYESVAKSLRDAAEDSGASAVLAVVDSPGGTVAGVEELAEAVESLQKPLYVFSPNLLASGAYWAFAGAEKIGVAATAQVGSIGVLTTHHDISKALDAAGLRITMIAAGRYKAVGNPVEPLSEDAQAYIQERIDYVYALFLGAVAKNRNLNVETSAQWADGQVFPAALAESAGLVDFVGTYSEFFQGIQKGLYMDKEAVKNQFPDTYRAILEDGKAGGVGEAKAEATKSAQSEAVRVIKTIFGDDVAEKIEKVFSSGVTAEQMEAMKAVFGDAVDSRKAILDGIREATPSPLHAGSVGPGGVDLAAMYDEEMQARISAGMSRIEASKDLAKKKPEIVRAWVKKQQAKGVE